MFELDSRVLSFVRSRDLFIFAPINIIYMPKQRHHSLLKIFRIVVAAVVFCAFILLFLNPGNVMDRWLGWLPKLQFWPAALAVNIASFVLIIVLTMVFGRVYCSMLCPLGIMQDIIYRVRISGKKKNRFKQGFMPAIRSRKPILLLFILIFCFGHASVACLIEPYSIFGRMVTSITAKSLMLASVSLVTLAIITFMVLKYGRLWCNSICPVGTFLGIFSRNALMKPSIDDDKCVGCGLCAKGCRASCIDPDHHEIDSSRCVACFDCIDNCSTGAIDFKYSLPSRKKKADKAPEDSSRRAFITATALTAGSLALKAQEGHGALGLLKERQQPQRRTPVVPAGALSLNNLSVHCVACQLCVDACPNNVLSPDTSLARLMQPKMDFEKGWCRPECNACSRVCPAGAIIKVEPEKKTAISIGHAVYNPELCVVKTDNVECGNCARHCPSGAISMVKSENLDGRRIPSVNAERCIGCGRCEYVCPSRPVSAIYVEGNLVHRSI